MATVNVFLKVGVIVNGEYQEIGDLYNPVALTASAGVMNQFELLVTGGGTVDTVFAASNAATLIVLVPSVAGTVLWRGANGDDDNSSVKLAAGQPFMLGGTTNDYANTVAGRAAATEAVISAVYFEGASAGTIKVFSIR